MGLLYLNPNLARVNASFNFINLNLTRLKKKMLPKLTPFELGLKTLRVGSFYPPLIVTVRVDIFLLKTELIKKKLEPN